MYAQNRRMVPFDNCASAAPAFIPPVVNRDACDQMPFVFVLYAMSYWESPLYLFVCQSTHMVPLLAWRPVSKILIPAFVSIAEGLPHSVDAEAVWIIWGRKIRPARDNRTRQIPRIGLCLKRSLAP